MTEDSSKEYKETMQEVMLELKLGTLKFLKKFNDECKKIEFNPVKITITISLRGEHRELEIDLFGIGDKIKNPDNYSMRNTRLVKSNTTIMKGVTLLHGKTIFFKEEGSLKTEFSDYNYIINISEKTLVMGVNVYAIADWLLEKIKNQDCKIIIEGKEVTNREELQTILNVLIQNTSKLS